ncbi:MAG: choice-of-anchor B family protein [Ignavibacteria bacterium]|nr:choice-of-anchor B family protein [Ignavibacteria bacterium]
MKKLLLAFFAIFITFSITGNSEAQLGNKNMYLLANVNTHSTPYSALWGYKAPDGREYAILGTFDGTQFVDITDASNIHEVGFIASTSPGDPNNLWREMKTYSHYAYLVSEVRNSGIQIVDLQYLPDSVHYVKKFVPAGHTFTHSISQSGPYLYLNGCNPGFGNGVTVLDLTVNPETPVKRGGYNVDYIHDCRIVNDTIYAANVYISKVSIINATNKNTLTGITSFINIANSGPHNTAVTDDRKHILVTDEVGNLPRALKIWNIQDLGNITYVTNWQPTGITSAVIHNVEIYGKYALIAHYSAGVRLVDISNPAVPTEVAYYDTYPSNDFGNYEGCWGVYMFPSGKIIASDRSTGLYVLKTNFNISAVPEGFYNSSTNSLNAKDTVRAFLRSASSPYNIIDSSKALIDSVSFTGSFKFNTAPSGTYYVVIKHRNSIETWSRSSGEIYNPMTLGSYNFSDSLSKAYGSNMKQVDFSPVRFAAYSGDVDQDGSVDASDVSSIDNDAYNSVTGYVNTDLTGDKFVDAIDVSIVDNNSSNTVSAIIP